MSYPATCPRAHYRALLAATPAALSAATTTAETTAIYKRLGEAKRAVERAAAVEAQRASLATMNR